MLMRRLLIFFLWMLYSHGQEETLSDGQSEDTEQTTNSTLFDFKGYPNPGDIPLLNRKIFRGERVTIREHPYIVSIRRLQSHYMTGTLISKNLVISIAHPIFNVPTYDLEVVAGENYSDRGTKLLTVILVLIHNEFDPYTLVGDIALLRFYEDVVYRSHVKSIALVAPKFIVKGQALVTGWGRCDFTGNELCLPRANKYFPDEKADPMLRSIYVEVSSSNYYCNGYQLNGTPLRKGMLCVGTAREENSVAPCLAVPGAPLVVNAKLAGILSWGFGCGYQHDLPLVYTDIKYYTPWLLHNIPILRNIKSYNVSVLFTATKSYIIMKWLNSTRIVRPLVHNHMNKPLEHSSIDEVLVTLNGHLYDLRDYIFNKQYQSAKKDIYEYLKKSISEENSTNANTDQELQYISRLTSFLNNKTMSINFSGSESSDEEE